MTFHCIFTGALSGAIVFGLIAIPLLWARHQAAKRKQGEKTDA